MNRLFERFIRRAARTPQLRQAAEETLADWRHEVGQARNAVIRSLCHVRVVAAFGRLTTAAIVQGVLESRRDLSLACGWLLAMFAVSFAPTPGWYRAFDRAGAEILPALVASAFLGFAAAFTPVALFLAVQRPRESSRPSRPRPSRLSQSCSHRGQLLHNRAPPCSWGCLSVRRLWSCSEPNCGRSVRGPVDSLQWPG